MARSSGGRVNRYVIVLAFVVVSLIFWASSGRSVGSGSGTGRSGGAGEMSTAGDKIGDYVTIDGSIPETIYVDGVPGFNYFKNLYLAKGVFYAITSDPSSIPETGAIMSAFPDDDPAVHDAAGEDRWKVLVLGVDNLESVLGRVAIRKTGISMFFNDEAGKNSVSFLKHYFHCEVFLGAWRVLRAAGESELPTRLMYRTFPEDWRDHAGLTSWFQQSVMPHTAVEEASVWQDRSKSGQTFLFDKITITDRWAAHGKGVNPKFWNKMTADLVLVSAPKDWMEPLRQSMKRLIASDGCSVQRKKKDVPVVTYVNRQLTGRRLRTPDAEALLVAMRALESEGVIEFNDAVMEKKSRIEQFCLALRSDIIMGVHGNGLSHALWMKPGSAMLEFMKPTGFARDYAMIGELMNHDYYAIHDDHVFPPEKWAHPDGYGVDQGEGFHGNSIPVNAKFLSGFIRDIASQKKGMVEPL